MYVARSLFAVNLSSHDLRQWKVYLILIFIWFISVNIDLVGVVRKLFSNTSLRIIINSQRDLDILSLCFGITHEDRHVLQAFK